MERFYQGKRARPIYTNPEMPTELIAKGIQQKQKEIDAMKDPDLERETGEYVDRIHNTDILTSTAIRRRQAGEDLDKSTEEYYKTVNNLTNENFDKAQRQLKQLKGKYEAFGNMVERDESLYEQRQKYKNSIARSQDKDILLAASDYNMSAGVARDPEYNYQGYNPQKGVDIAKRVTANADRLKADGRSNRRESVGSIWNTTIGSSWNKITAIKVDDMVTSTMNDPEVEREYKARGKVNEYKRQDIRNRYYAGMIDKNTRDKMLSFIPSEEDEAFAFNLTKMSLDDIIESEDGINTKEQAFNVKRKTLNNYGNTWAASDVGAAYNLTFKKTTYSKTLQKNPTTDASGNKLDETSAVRKLGDGSVSETFTAKELIEGSKENYQRINDLGAKNNDLDEQLNLIEQIQAGTSKAQLLKNYNVKLSRMPESTRGPLLEALSLRIDELKNTNPEQLALEREDLKAKKAQTNIDRKAAMDEYQDQTSIILDNLTEEDVNRFKEDMEEKLSDAPEAYMKVINESTVVDLDKREGWTSENWIEFMRDLYMSHRDFAVNIFDYLNDKKDIDISYNYPTEILETKDKESGSLNRIYSSNRIEDKNIQATNAADEEDKSVTTGSNSKTSFVITSKGVYLKHKWKGKDKDGNSEGKYVIRNNTLEPQEMVERETDLVNSERKSNRDHGWALFGAEELGRDFRKLSFTPGVGKGKVKYSGGTIDLSRLNGGKQLTVNYNVLSENKINARVYTDVGGGEETFDSSKGLQDFIIEKLSETKAGKQLKEGTYVRK